MYLENLQILRENCNLSQEALSKTMKFKRSTYGTWENGTIMISLENLDKLTLFYNVSLKFILGLTKENDKHKIKALKYDLFLNKVNNLKTIQKLSYAQISAILHCHKSTVMRYFKGSITIPIDRLILLSNFFKVDIDLLCCKI